MVSLLVQIFTRLELFPSIVCFSLFVSLFILALCPAESTANHSAKPVHREESQEDKTERFWNSIPSTKLGYGIKANLKSIFHTSTIIRKDYETFSTRDQLFGFSSLGSGRMAILPQSLVHVLNKPEDQISARLEQWQIIQPLYTIGADEKIFSAIFRASTNVAWKYLPRLYGTFARINEEETAIGLRRLWGKSDDWTSVNLFSTCCDIMTRTSLRAVLGEALCRSDQFVRICQRFSVAVFGYAGMISSFPRPAQRILGPVIGFPARRIFESLRRELEPVVQQRLQESRDRPTKTPGTDDEKGSGRPDDILDWMIREGRKSQPVLLEEHNLTLALAILIMQSSFSMGYTLTNCILDTFSSENPEAIVEALRNEVDPILERFNGFGSKEAVGSLLGIDSCIRESLRFTGFSVIQPIRVTATPIELNGMTIPTGIKIGVPLQAIHHDSRFYANPERFDPFRYSRARAINEDVQAGRSKKQELSADVSTKFLAYGFGRHACPGRFFASQMLQIALANIVRDYDILKIPSRPKELPLLNILRPPTAVTIQLRRRRLNEGSPS